MRVGMLTYSFYENDNRVRRYAETLASLGHEVDVICLRKPGQPHFESDRGVRVYRTQRREKAEKSRFEFLAKNVLFFIRTYILLSYLYCRRRHTLIHVHNPPDFLVFAALIPKLGGAKIVLDIHDIMPELYKSKFKAHQDSLGYRSLLLMERVSAKLADHVIVANHIWHSRYTSRSAAPSKCTVIMNYPDSSIFHQRPRARGTEPFTFIYPGSLSFHQGLDVAIRAFSILSKKKRIFQFRIFGSGAVAEELVALVAGLGLREQIRFYDPLPLQEIASEVGKADCGVVPKRIGGFGEEAFSTKILEFMSLGVPVIASDTKIDRYYFNDSVVLFFRSEDVEDLAKKLEQIIDDAPLRNSLINHGLEFSKSFSWDVKKNIYLDLVRMLLMGKHIPASQLSADKSRSGPFQ